jgi:hypothetical protein
MMIPFVTTLLIVSCSISMLFFSEIKVITDHT